MVVQAALVAMAVREATTAVDTVPAEGMAVPAETEVQAVTVAEVREDLPSR